MNKMRELAKILGLKMNEKFDAITNCERNIKIVCSPYCFTENGLIDYSLEVDDDEFVIYDALLTGKARIKKC